MGDKYQLSNTPAPTSSPAAASVEPRSGTSKSCMEMKKLMDALALKQKEQMEEDLRVLGDTPESIQSFCRKFHEVTLNVRAKKEAEKKAKAKAKEDRKASMLAALILTENRRQTRLATGALRPKPAYREPPMSVPDSSAALSVANNRKSREPLIPPILSSSATSIWKRNPSSGKKRSSTSPAVAVAEKNTVDGAHSRCPLGRNDAGWVQGDEWEIAKIVDAKIDKNKNMYKVRWKGWNMKYDEWVPEANVRGQEPIVQFWQQMKEQTRKFNGQSLRRSPRM